MFDSPESLKKLGDAVEIIQSIITKSHVEQSMSSMRTLTKADIPGMKCICDVMCSIPGIGGLFGMLGRVICETISPNEVNKCNELYCRYSECDLSSLKDPKKFEENFTALICNPKEKMKELFSMDHPFQSLKNIGSTISKIIHIFQLLFYLPMKTTKQKVFYAMSLVGTGLQLVLDICDAIGISVFIPKSIQWLIKGYLFFQDNIVTWIFFGIDCASFISETITHYKKGEYDKITKKLCL